jgi:hypothetical protein
MAAMAFYGFYTSLDGRFSEAPYSRSEILAVHSPPHRVGTGYFDFKGRDGLIQLVESFVPDNHHLVAIIKLRKRPHTRGGQLAPPISLRDLQDPSIAGVTRKV